MDISLKRRKYLDYSVLIVRDIMKKYSSLILLFSVVLNSCAHVIPKYKNVSSEDFYNRINYLCKEMVVTIKLKNAQVINCKEIIVNKDSTSYLDLASSTFRTIETTNIFSISFSDSERGGWEGFLLGSFLGGAAGFLSNYILPKGHPSGDPLLIIYGALTGAVLGIVYGYIHESQITINLGDGF